VQEIASRCRSQGQKYCDPDFPPDERSLYIDGRGPGAARSVADLPSAWCRASEGAFSGARPPLLLPSVLGAAQLPPFDQTSAVSGSGGGTATEALIPGPILGVQLMGALAAIRASGKEPRELIVWREPEAGVYGVRLFKDGAWMYEILDDHLPLKADGQPACCQVVAGVEVQDWAALVEKAYAKVHGCYEAASSSANAEAEALEDCLGLAPDTTTICDFPIWGELWQAMRSKRSRSFVQLAVRRGQEQQGELLTNGLLSGYSYPVTRLEIVDGEMLCELHNPWHQGEWNGRWGPHSRELLSRRGTRQLEPTPDSCRPFWMSIQDFTQHFTDIVEARQVPGFWQSASVTCSSERPSYPLVSVSSSTQAVFAVTQPDRRWSQREGYDCALGLRLYRCRIIAPPQNAVGVRQNVSSPFTNLELLAERPPAKVRSIFVEVARLEPDCLYIATVDMEDQPLSCATLRVLTASAPRFRELFAPESSYFLQAQPNAPQAVDNDSFSSQGSVEYGAAGVSPSRRDPMRLAEAKAIHGKASGTWKEWAEDEDAIHLPAFLKACIASCSAMKGEC